MILEILHIGTKNDRQGHSYIDEIDVQMDEWMDK